MPRPGPDVRIGPPPPEAGAPKVPDKFQVTRGGAVQGREIESRARERALAKGRVDGTLSTGELDISKRMDELRDTWQSKDMAEARSEVTSVVKSQFESPTVTTVSRRKGRLQSATQFSGAYHELPKLFDHFGIRGPDALDQIARMPAEQQLRVANQLRPLLEQVYASRGGDGRAEFELLSPQEILQESYDFAGTVARELIARESVKRFSNQMDIDHDKRERAKASVDQLDKKVGRWGFIRSVKDSFHARTKTRREVGRMKNLLQLKAGSPEWERVKAAFNKVPEGETLPEVDKNFQKRRERELMLQAIAAEEIGSTDFSSDEFKKILTDRGVSQDSFQRFLSGEDSEELYKDMGKAFTERAVDNYRKNRTIQDLAGTEQQLHEARIHLENVSRSNDMREISGAFNTMRKLERKRKYYARGWDVKNKINVAKFKAKEAAQTDRGELSADIAHLRTKLWGKIVEAKAGGIALNLKDWIIDTAHQADSVGYEVTKGLKGRVVQAVNSVGDRVTRRWEMHDDDSTIYKNLERPKYVATRFNVLARETRSNEEMSDRVGGHRTKAKELVGQIILAEATAARDSRIVMPGEGRTIISPPPEPEYNGPRPGGGGETGGPRRDTIPVVPTTPERTTPAGSTPSVEPASETGTRAGAAAETTVEARVNTQDAIKLSMKALDEEIKKLREEAFKQFDPDGKPNAPLMFQADQAQVARRMLQAETDGNPLDAFTQQQRDLYVAGGQVQLPIFEMMNATEYGPVISRVQQPLSPGEQARIRPLLEQQAREFLARTSKRADRATIDQIVNDSLYQFSFMDRDRMIKFFDKHKEIVLPAKLGERTGPAEVTDKIRNETIRFVTSGYRRVLDDILASTPVGARDADLILAEKAIAEIEGSLTAGLPLDQALRFNYEAFYKVGDAGRQVQIGLPVLDRMLARLNAENSRILRSGDWENILNDPAATAALGLTTVNRDRVLDNKRMLEILRGKRRIKDMTPSQLPEAARKAMIEEELPKSVGPQRIGTGGRGANAAELAAAELAANSRFYLMPELAAQTYANQSRDIKTYEEARDGWLEHLAPESGDFLTARVARPRENDMESAAAQAGRREVNGKIKHGYELMLEELRVQAHINPDGSPAGGHTPGSPEETRFLTAQTAYENAQRTSTDLIAAELPIYDEALTALDTKLALLRDNPGGAGVRQLQEIQRTRKVTGIDTLLMAAITGMDPPDENMRRQTREVLRRQTGLDDASVDRLLASLTVAAGVDVNGANDEMEHMLPKEARALFLKLREAGRTESLNAFADQATDILTRRTPTDVELRGLAELVNGNQAALNRLAEQIVDLNTPAAIDFLVERAAQPRGNADVRILLEVTQARPDVMVDFVLNRLNTNPEQVNKLLGELLQYEPVGRSFVEQLDTDHPVISRRLVSRFAVQNPDAGRRIIEQLVRANRARAETEFNNLTIAPHADRADSIFADLARGDLTALTNLLNHNFGTAEAALIEAVTDNKPLRNAHPILTTRLGTDVAAPDRPEHRAKILRDFARDDPANFEKFLRLYRARLTTAATPHMGPPDPAAVATLNAFNTQIHDFVRGNDVGLSRFLGQHTDARGVPEMIGGAANHDFDDRRGRMNRFLTNIQPPDERVNVMRGILVQAPDLSRQIIQDRVNHGDIAHLQPAFKELIQGTKARQEVVEFARPLVDGAEIRRMLSVDITPLPQPPGHTPIPLITSLRDTIATMASAYPEEAAKLLGTLAQTAGGSDPAREIFRSLAVNPADANDMSKLDRVAEVFATMEPNVYRMLIKRVTAMEPDLLNKALAEDIISDQIKRKDTEIADLDGTLKFVRGVTDRQTSATTRADRMRVEVERLERTVGPATTEEQFKILKELAERNVDAALAAAPAGPKVISASKVLREVDRQQQASERYAPEAVKSINETTEKYQDAFVRAYQDANWNPIIKQERGMQLSAFSEFIIDRGTDRMTISLDVPKTDRKVEVGTPIFMGLDPTGRYVKRSDDERMEQMTVDWGSLSKDKQDALVAYAIQVTQETMSEDEQKKLLEQADPSLRGFSLRDLRGLNMDRIKERAGSPGERRRMQKEEAERKQKAIEAASRKIVIDRILSQARYIDPNQANAVYTRERERRVEGETP